MIVPSARLSVPVRALAGAAMLSLAASISGCANMSDGMTTTFFADPAKYDLYNCKQLEAERVGLKTRMAELQGLMTKASDSGVGGSVVAEVAYSNDYTALRGQLTNANTAWAANKCQETPPKPASAPSSPAPAAAVKPSRSQIKSGSASY